jgi:Protein tyrosine and serine/threonine kinase
MVILYRFCLTLNLGCRCHAHPNIVQLKEVFLTTHYLAIVMEYMKGSNMPTYLAKHAPLPEPVARCGAAAQLEDTFLLINFREIIWLRSGRASLSVISPKRAGGSSSSSCWCSIFTTAWA